MSRKQARGQNRTAHASKNVNVEPVQHQRFMQPWKPVGRISEARLGLWFSPCFDPHFLLGIQQVEICVWQPLHSGLSTQPSRPYLRNPYAAPGRAGLRFNNACFAFLYSCGQRPQAILKWTETRFSQPWWILHHGPQFDELRPVMFMTNTKLFSGRSASYHVVLITATDIRSWPLSG